MATQRIALTQPIESRNGTFAKDSYSSNCVFETRDQKREYVKRPGLIALSQITPVTPPAYLKSRGLTSFRGSIIAAINTTVYDINPVGYAATGVGSTSGSANPVYFAKTFLETYLFIQNGVNGYLYSSASVFTTLGGTFPSGPFVPGAVFLDDYIFVGTTNNRIYNCAVGDPTTWNALDFVSFNQASDNLVGITKHLNYLVAFGKASMLFYYDAGNPSGSPLGLAESYTAEIGCASGDSIVSTDNTVIWVGTSKTSGRSVYIMDGVSPIKVSTHNIDKHLEADSLSQVSAYCYKFNGHTCYVLTLHGTNHKTLVYDLNSKMWYTWTQYSMQSNDQPNPGTYQESYFRATYYSEVLGVSYMLDDDTATLYTPSTTTYQDNGQPIYCRAVTDIVDNGTTKRKFYGRLEIIGDKVVGTMQVRHSGDDYNTWSSYRSIDLNAPRSQVYLSGADRRRAWEFLVTSNCALRLDGAEIDFRIGEMDQEQSVGGQNYRGGGA